MTRRDSPRQRPLPHVETWIFDLDNTLYPARHNLFDLVDRRIGEFIARAIGLDPTAARRLQKDYFRDYGTTLRGLMLNHGIDPRAFLDFVHDIDVRRVPPSPALETALARLDGRKVVFTNASTRHAERVVARLGVERHIDGIFDIEAAGFVPKPHPEAYSALVAHHDIEPRAAAMVEDIARNLEPAAALGMTTVWVRTRSPWAPEASDTARVDHTIDDLAEWLGALLGAVDTPGPPATLGARTATEPPGARDERDGTRADDRRGLGATHGDRPADGRRRARGRRGRTRRA